MNAPHELAVLHAMADELEKYLLAEALFWPISGRSNFPQLSLGMLLLTRARLRALAAQLSPAQRTERERVEGQIDTLLSRWPVAAEQKAGKELHTRLNLWQAFLAESRETPQASAENYAQDVTHRTMATLLLRQFPRLVDLPEAGRLSSLDAPLRARFKPGNFVWPIELQSELPRSEFWFLYGTL